MARAQTEAPGRKWIATPKQMEFLRAKEDEVLYGGAAGGGKSDALLIFSILRRQTIPKSKGLILRRTFPELERSLILRSKELLSGAARWQGQQKRWVFPNGSILEFGYCENETDVFKYQSAEYEDICFDELTQFTEFQFSYLGSRLRTTKKGVRCFLRAATNPGNIGHGWVRNRFVDAAPWGQTYVDPESGLTRKFIPATLDDNPHIAKDDYERRLNALPDAERRALRYGDWDVFAGQVFREFRRDLHVVEPIEIPAEWRKWRGMDFGYTAPACCLWFAIDPEHTVYVYRELYVTELPASDFATKIVDLSTGERISYTLADPATFAKTGHEGESIEVTMRKNGVPLMKANNDRIAGKNIVHEYLKQFQDISGETRTRLKIFASCTNLIRTLPELVYDKHRPEDVDTRGEDHAYDALRYGLMQAAAPMDQKKKRRKLPPSGVSSITGY